MGGVGKDNPQGMHLQAPVPVQPISQVVSTAGEASVGHGPSAVCSAADPSFRTDHGPGGSVLSENAALGSSSPKGPSSAEGSAPIQQQQVMGPESNQPSGSHHSMAGAEPHVPEGGEHQEKHQSSMLTSESSRLTQDASYSEPAGASDLNLDRPRPLELLPLDMPRSLPVPPSNSVSRADRRLPGTDAHQHLEQENVDANIHQENVDANMHQQNRPAQPRVHPSKPNIQQTSDMPAHPGASASDQFDAATGSSNAPGDCAPAASLDALQMARSVAANSHLLKRLSHADSNASGVSDAGQSISSSIAAQLIPEQAGALMLSHPSLDSHVPGRIALQQEGWRAPRSHKRSHKGGLPTGQLAHKASVSRLSDRKPPLQQARRSVEGIGDAPKGTDAPAQPGDSSGNARKRQHRVEGRSSPVPTLHNEGWQARGAQPVAGQTAGLLPPPLLSNASSVGPGLFQACFDLSGC